MSALRTPCAVLLALGLSSCSLVKLSEDIVVEACTRHADCAGLDDPQAEGFPCQQWQCNVDDGRCELRATDLDDDGQSPGVIEIDGESFECDVPAAERDCDDEADDRRAGADEVCDGVDNDCDGRVDEGVLQEREPRRLVSFDDSDGADAVAYAYDASSGTLALAHALSGEAPGLSLVPAGGDSAVSAALLRVEGPAALSATQVAVASMGGDRYAVVFVNETGPRGLVAGVVAAASPGELGVESAVAMQALGCGSAEQCARRTLAPAIAADGDDVLVAFLQAGDDLPACGDGASASEQPELQLSALVRRGGEQLNERDDNPLSLGPSAGPAGAAVLAVDGLPDAPGGRLGFLVAHVDGGGALQVVHVRIEAGRAELAPQPLLELEPGEGALGAPALALGPEQGEGRVLSLAYTRGCGADARVVAELHVLRIDGEGALALQRSSEAVEVGAGRGARDPALAYSATHDAWAVAYQDADGLRARLLERRGEPRASESYLLVENESDDSVFSLLSPGVLPLPGGWFGVVAPVKRQSRSPERAFELHPLACAP